MDYKEVRAVLQKQVEVLREANDQLLSKEDPNTSVISENALAITNICGFILQCSAAIAQQEAQNAPGTLTAVPNVGN